LIVYPDDHFSVNVLIDYNSKILRNQYSILDSIEDFEEKISKSRTFVFFHELEPLIIWDLLKVAILIMPLSFLKKK